MIFWMPIIVAVFLVAFGAWFAEYVLLRNPWWTSFKPHIPRRHLEGVSAWAERQLEAMGRLNDAERAIVESPDAVKTRLSSRGYSYSLPLQHSLSVKRIAALYPDGPPYDLLAQLAGISGDEPRVLS